MKNNLIFKGLAVLLLMGAFQASVLAAPACKGPNKNDPGCEEEAAAAAAAVVDSVTVDWLNQKLVVRGSGLAGATTFVLGNSVSLGVASVTDTELDIPFNLDMADEVLSQGNYNLKVDGAVQLSVFIESQIIDPGDTGCPCQADWTLEPAVKWGIPSADCLEIEGPFSNDIADISGTIFSDYPVGAAYPQHPIGASFYPGEPDSSVCRLVEVNSDATTTDLVNKRINENQQATCATELKANVCATVTLFP